MAKTEKKSPKGEGASSVKRLLVANLVALLAFVTLTAAVLFATGLLGSIFAFIF